MSERGANFMHNWLSENVHVDVYPEEGKPDERIPPLVEQCIDDARAKGINRKEIEDAMGPLHDCIGSALIEATDAEVDRLVAKDL